jgi:hypothetical protein
MRFRWFEACLIAFTSYGAASACSSTSSHSVGDSPDSGAGRGGAGGGGSGATSGRGGAAGSGGVSGSGGTSAGASGGGGTSGSGGAGGTEAGDASAGTAGTGGTAGSGGSAGTSGTAGTNGASGSAGTSGTGGRGGTTGTAGSAGTGGAPMDAGPPRWCTTQARPAGVAAADYQCLDFEGGLPPTGTWAPISAGVTSRMLTNARASSLPQSLLTGTSGATGTARQEARLEWQNVGSTGVSSLSIAADINPVNFAGVAPPWTGSIDLLCVGFGSAEACFSYTRGADLSFADGYTGYFIDHTFSGGPAYQRQCQLTGNLTANLWTRVELRLTRNPATIQVFIAGASAGQCSAGVLDDTVTAATFGQIAFPDTPGWTVYYDNVIAVVRR